MTNLWWPLKEVHVTGEWANSPDFYKQFNQKGHNGIDLRAAIGTPVYASEAGTIEFEGWGQNHSWMGPPAGISILIRHTQLFTGYAHLSQTIVNKGQKVKQGQLIGYTGSTGASTGPHLHFEVLPAKPDFTNGFAGRVNPNTLGIKAYGTKQPTKPTPKPASSDKGTIKTASGWWNYKTAADAKAKKNRVAVMPAGTYSITHMSGDVPHLRSLDGRWSGWVHPSVFGTPKKSNATIAKEIVKGVNGKNPWGDGQTRIIKLKAAGYDPVKVQQAVEQLLKKK